MLVPPTLLRTHLECSEVDDELVSARAVDATEEDGVVALQWGQQREGRKERARKHVRETPGTKSSLSEIQTLNRTPLNVPSTDYLYSNPGL